MNKFSITDPQKWPNALADVRTQMGEPLNVHRFLASYPEWLSRWWEFRNHVIHGTSLNERHYELVVLRVATLCDAAYEWEHHVVTGKERGLVDEDIARIQVGPSATEWNSADRSLLTAVDECVVSHRICAETLSTLSGDYTDEQVLDIIATVVMYQAMAIVTRTFDIPIDEKKPSFTEETYRD